MRVEQLDAMPVRIAEIDERRVTRAMPPRPALDRSAKAELARDIAGLQQVMVLLREECRVMQLRTCAMEEYDVVRIALALQEDAAQFAAERDVFGQAEAHAGVEFERARHMRRHDLKMV